MSVAFAAGSLLVLNENGDNAGGLLGACVISDTGTVLGTQLLPGGEQAEILTNGKMLIAGEGTDATYAENFYLYDTVTNGLLATIPCQVHQSSVSPVRGNGTTFYVPQLDRTLITISDSGVIGGTTWTLPADSDAMSCGSPNRAGTIYYYGSDAVHHAVVNRYDLTNDTALSVLFDDGGSTTRVGRDILVTASGTILVVVEDPRSANTWEVRHYQADGTLLRTDAVGTNTQSAPRIQLGLDDPISYWTMSFPGTFHSLFTQRNVSTGATIGVPFSKLQDETGITGPSQSCPLLLFPVAFNPTPVLGTTVHRKMRRVRRAPHLWDGEVGARIFYPGFQLLVETGADRPDLTTIARYALRWSDDGGFTWSNEYWVEAGTIGQYKLRALWRRLGYSRDRIFEVIDDFDGKSTILDALLVPDPIQGAG